MPPIEIEPLSYVAIIVALLCLTSFESRVHFLVPRETLVYSSLTFLVGALIAPPMVIAYNFVVHTRDYSLAPQGLGLFICTAIACGSAFLLYFDIKKWNCDFLRVFVGIWSVGLLTYLGYMTWHSA